MTDQLEEIKRAFIDKTLNELLGLRDKLVDVDVSNFDLQTDGLANEVFMAMHAISGTAPMVGLETLAPLSQKLEIVYDKIRRGEKTFSEQINVQTIRGIDALIAELKIYSEKIALH
jgi:chemotaxis protein histidine kinase CheA